MADDTVLLTPPLSREDALTVVHAHEALTLTASLQTSTIEDTERYGQARAAVAALLRGERARFPSTQYEASRRIMARGHAQGEG